MTRLGNLVRSLARRTGSHVPTGIVPGHVAPPDAANAANAAVTYTPAPDGEPDPGEVVWAWVPYEDDPSRGKDRPVLLIGRHGGHLVGLQLTSQDHDLDAADEARYGRHWMDIGTGAWDHERRPSEVRLDRLVRLTERSVRREGAVLDPNVFDEVVRAARLHHPDLG